jgi:hypothetical protein
MRAVKDVFIAEGDPYFIEALSFMLASTCQGQSARRRRQSMTTTTMLRALLELHT